MNFKENIQCKLLDAINSRCHNPDSVFEFDTQVLVKYLPYHKAVDFLKEGVTEEQWKKESYTEKTKENVLTEMREYMEFAWEKAGSHRGISAGRSIEKMQTWLWLLEDDEMVEFADEDSNYKYYGCPILAKISEKYEFPIPEDEGVQNMIKGLPCGSYDGCGCGE